MRAVGNVSPGPGKDAVCQGSRVDGDGGGIDRDGVESFPQAFVGRFGGWGLAIGGQRLSIVDGRSLIADP